MLIDCSLDAAACSGALVDEGERKLT
jgi:hypothetical protein